MLIPIPGTLEYATDSTVRLNNNHTINGLDMLNYYMIAYDPITGTGTYQLPNGSVFYIVSNEDGSGSTLRIEENGTICAIGDYTFNYDKDNNLESIGIGYGVTINLVEGTLDVEEYTSFDVVMSAVSADWLAAMGLFKNNGGISIRTTKKGSNNTSEEIEFIIEQVNQTEDQYGYIWYCMQGRRPGTSGSQNADVEVYMIGVKEDTVQFFRLTEDEDIVSTCYDDVFRSENIGSGKHGDWYVTTRTRKQAFLSQNNLLNEQSLIIRNETEWYEFSDFFGTGVKVRVKYNESTKAWTYEYESGKVGFISTWTALPVTVTPLGTTIGETDVEALKTLNGYYWMLNAPVKKVLKEVVCGDGSLTANEGDHFVFTQPDHETKPNWHYEYWPLRITAYSRYVEGTYFKIEEVSAFLSNEAFTTQIIYETVDDKGNIRTIYEKRNANGTLEGYYEYWTDNGVEKTARVTVSTDLIKEIQGTGVYKLMSGTEGYKYGSDTLAGGFSTVGEKPVTAAGTYYYPYALLNADGSVSGYHSNLLVKVVYGANGASITGVSLIEVTPEQTTEISKAEEGLYNIKGTAGTTTFISQQVARRETGKSIKAGDTTISGGTLWTLEKDGSQYYEVIVTDNGKKTSYIYQYNATTKTWSLKWTYENVRSATISGEALVELFYAYYDKEQASTETTPTITDESLQLYAKKADYDKVSTTVTAALYTISPAGILSACDASAGTLKAVIDPDNSTTVKAIVIPEVRTDLTVALTCTEVTKEVTTDYHKVTYTRETGTKLAATGRVNLSLSSTRTVASGDGKQKLVLRFGQTVSGEAGGLPEPATMTFTGPINDISLNPIQIPVCDVLQKTDNRNGYQITDKLYMTNDGLIVMINGAFSSKYDGKRYVSSNLSMDNLSSKEPAQNGTWANITLNAGQNIWREMRTDRIATDMNGYWYLANEDAYAISWTRIAKDGNTETESIVLDDDGMGTITYNGTVYLEISKGKDENGKPVLLYTLPLFTGASVSGHAQAGSDGKVVLLEKTGATQKLFAPDMNDPNKGTDFNVQTIRADGAGQSVIITLRDPNGSILDGDAPAKDDNDISAYSSVQIVSSSSGTIGTHKNPLEISAPVIDMVNMLEDSIIETDTHLYVDEDSVAFLKDTIVDGVVWELVTKDGDIIFGDEENGAIYSLTVINGGDAILKTNKLQMEGGAYVANTEAVMNGDLMLRNLFVNGADANGNPSRADFDTEGDIIIEKIRADHGQIGMEAGGDIRFDNAMIHASGLSMSADGTLGMREGGGTYCGEYGQRAYIEVDPDGSDRSTLQLSGASIGNEDNRLIVDIPQDVTLQIDRVGNLYLDALQIIPEVQKKDGTYEEARVTALDPALRIDRVSHPDNPMVNEYTGTEVKSGQSVDGDWLEHITDEVHTGAIPLQENGEIAQRIVEKKGDGWASVIDSDAVAALLADQTQSTAITATVTEEDLRRVIEGMRGETQVPSTADRNLTDWILNNTDSWKKTLDPELVSQVEAKLEDPESEPLTDEEILAVVENFTPDEDEEEAWREARLTEIISTADENGDPAGIKALVQALKQKESEEERIALLTALLDLQTAEDSTEEPVKELEALIGSLLTDEEKEALYAAALGEAQIPEEAQNGYEDPAPRPIHVQIGISTGETNIYNDGSIIVTVTGTGVQDSDLTVNEIRSERGDVTVSVEKGSLLTTGDGEENILGANVALKARDDIAQAQDAIELQQRDNMPTVTANIIGETPDHSAVTGTVHRNEDGEWVMDTVLTYDWVRKDAEDAVMRLDAVAENGSATVTEIEGGTGLGTVFAGENVTLITDGDLTDVRTEKEKADGANNIKAGNDVYTGVENGTVGTKDDPIKVEVGGHMTVEDEGDIHVTSQEDLSITADTQEGVVNVHSDKNLELDNTPAAAGGTGDMVLQNGTAGANATVTVSGNLTDSNVGAGNDATVTAAGDVTASSVTAGGTATVTAGGDIRTDEEGTLFKGDSVALHADADNDGEGSVGTQENPVQVDTASGNTGAGTLTATGTEICVNEQSGDLAIREITATQGDALITTPGSVTDAGDESAAQEAADAAQEASDKQNIADQAQDQADVLDEWAAGLEEEAQKARDEANEARDKANQAADLASDAARTAADAAQTAADSQKIVDDLLGDIAAIEQQLADLENDSTLTEEEKQQKRDELQKQKEALEKELPQKQLDAAQAAKEADEKQKAADTLKRKADRLDQQAKAVEDIADEKEAVAQAARDQANAAQQYADEKQAEADAAHQKADEAAQRANSDDPTVETAGNLEIHAGGDVGSKDDPLDTNVGGSVTIGAPGDVCMTDQGDMHIADLDADKNAADDRDVSLTAGGDLTSDKPITGGSAEINTPNGSVGTDDRPLELDVDELTGTIGKDANITNSGDLLIDDLSVGGDLDLNVNGSITAGNAADGTANITAVNAEIHAGGDIGSKDDPLITAVDELTMTGDDINIHNMTDLEIDRIEGDDISVGVDGRVTAGDSEVNIKGDNLDMDVFGSVGTEDRPLVVEISGRVSITSQYGKVFYENVYREPEEENPVNNRRTVRTRRYELGIRVLRKDGKASLYRLEELFRVKNDPDDEELLDMLILRTRDNLKLILKNVKPEQCAEGRILGIFALEDDGETVTGEIRYLLLTEETRQKLRGMGFRWVVFLVGDRALLIDLDALEEKGDYLFGLDPKAEGELIDQRTLPQEEQTETEKTAAVWYENELIMHWDEENNCLGKEHETLEESVILSETVQILPMETED